MYIQVIELGSLAMMTSSVCTLVAFMVGLCVNIEELFIKNEELCIEKRVYQNRGVLD